MGVRARNKVARFFVVHSVRIYQLLLLCEFSVSRGCIPFCNHTLAW